MRVTIMQPAYLPWMGFFHRISLADRFVLLDDVLIDKSSKTKFANRNKVRTKDGWTWLSVPIKSKGRSEDLFLDRIETVEDGWERSHGATLKGSYGKAPHWRTHGPFFEEVYGRRWERLFDVTQTITGYLLEKLELRTEVVRASSLKVEGAKDDLIVNLCVAAGATEYISGPFGRTYLDGRKFEAAGIKLFFHDYAHPTYAQAHPGFEPYMTAVDLLLNLGPDAREVLGRDQPPLATA